MTSSLHLGLIWVYPKHMCMYLPIKNVSNLKMPTDPILHSISPVGQGGFQITCNHFVGIICNKAAQEVYINTVWIKFTKNNKRKAPSIYKNITLPHSQPETNMKYWMRNVRCSSKWVNQQLIKTEREGRKKNVRKNWLSQQQHFCHSVSFL